MDYTFGWAIFISSLITVWWLIYQHGQRQKQRQDYDKTMLEQALMRDNYKIEPNRKNNDEWIAKIQREGHERGYMVTVGGKMMPGTSQWGLDDLAKIAEQRRNFWELMHRPIDWNKELDELRDKNRSDKPPDGDRGKGTAQG